MPPVKCQHCGREITRTEYDTWQDTYDPGYEVCDLLNDNGPSHSPAVTGARLVIGSPNRITLSFPVDRFGVSVLVTDMTSGAFRELSVSDLVKLIYGA